MNAEQIKYLKTWRYQANNKIPAIKAVREAEYMSLSDAKHAVEAYMNEPDAQKELTPMRLAEFIEGYKSCLDPKQLLTERDQYQKVCKEQSARINMLETALKETSKRLDEAECELNQAIKAFQFACKHLPE